MSVPPPKKDYLRVVLTVIVAVAAAAVFFPTLYADFVHWDDGVEIYRNPHLGPLTWDRIVWMFTDTKYVWRYQPLTWLGWTLNYQMFKLDASGYHMGNWLLHAASAVVLYSCLSRLFLLVAPQRDGRERLALLAGFMGAMLWALHPLRVEPVAWASGRLYCQSLFFLLLSFSFYLRARFPVGQRKRFNGDYWLAAAFLAASLLSYPVAVGYAPALVLLEVYLGYKAGHTLKQRWKDIVAHAVPMFVLTAGIFSISLLARFFVSEDFEAPQSIQAFGVAQRASQAAYIYAYFLVKPFWPTHLSPIYTQLLQVNPVGAQFLASWLILGITTLVAFVLRKRFPAIALVWGMHLVLLLPHLGLTEHPHYPSDRYSYVVGIVWSALIGSSILFVRNWRNAVALLGAVVIALSALSFRQVHLWENSVTLFSHMLEKLGNHPVRADIYSRLAVVHGEQGKFQEAANYLNDAIKIDPNFVDAYVNLGLTLQNAGQILRARENYLAALRINPERSDVHNSLGDIYFSLREYGEAEKHYREAIRLKPRYATAYSNLGIVLAGQSKTADAETAFRKAIELEPNGPEHYVNLSILMKRLGRTEESTALRAKADSMPPIPVQHYPGDGHQH